MNNIGQSLLPIQPASTNAHAHTSADSDTMEFADSFDSLLQHRIDESAEAAELVPSTVVVGTPAEDSVEPTDDSESPNYALQAEIPMPVGLPPAPIELLAPILMTDAAIEEIAPPQSDRVSPDIEPVTFTGPAKTAPETEPMPGERHTPIAPHSTSSPRRFNSPAPQSVSRPLDTQPTPEAPVPEAPSANRDVANVLGIFPPVKLLKTVEIEASPPSLTPVDAKQNLSVDATPAAVPPPATDRIDIRTANSPSTPFIEPETFGVTAPIGVKSETNEAPSAIPAAPTSTTPAIFSEQRGQPVPAKTENISRTVPTVETATASTTIAVHPTTETMSGTTAAKPGFEMSATTLQKSQPPIDSDFDGLARRNASPEAVPAAETQATRNTPLQAVPAQTQQNEREPSKREESNAEQKQPVPAIAIPAASTPSETTRTTFSEQPGAPIRTPDVQQVVTHTMQAVERLRVSGMERLDVAVKLDNGTDVTIQVRVENGQVTPLIRTESEPLRIALEQNWAQFAQRGGDRDGRITTPVFESPQTSSNMSDLNQQRDARQQAFKEQVPEFFQMPQPRRNARNHTPHTIAPTGAQEERVRLYA